MKPHVPSQAGSHDSSDRRARVCDALGLGVCSAKALLRLLNLYSFHRADLVRAVDAADAAAKPPAAAYDGETAAHVPKTIPAGSTVRLYDPDTATWTRGVVLSKVASGQNRGHARVKCDGQAALRLANLAKNKHARDWVLIDLPRAAEAAGTAPRSPSEKGS